MKERTNRDYIRFFHVYMYKHIAWLIILGMIVIPLVIFQDEVVIIYENLTHQRKQWQEFVYDDRELIVFEGSVRLLNHNQEVLYEGEFSNGKCNGVGTIYNQGVKVYEGVLVDNKMEDHMGILFHKNGNIAYQGDIHENLKQGTGTEYRKDGTLLYKGDFVNNKFEGIGMAYDEHSNITYEGSFLDGVYHGKGIQYEDGESTRKVYEGDFAFGVKNGEGTLYDIWGKAYYMGPMAEDHINYTAFFTGTLKDVKEHFLYPIKLYSYKEKMAATIPQLGLMFVFKDHILIDKKGETWKVLEDQKIDEKGFNAIVLVDDDINHPGGSMVKEDVEETWKSRASPMERVANMIPMDVLALSISKESLFVEKDGKLIDHSNELYEVVFPTNFPLHSVQVFPYEAMQFTYRQFIGMDYALYSVMEETTWEGVVK